MLLLANGDVYGCAKFSSLQVIMKISVHVMLHFVQIECGEIESAVCCIFCPRVRVCVSVFVPLRMEARTGLLMAQSQGGGEF